MIEGDEPAGGDRTSQEQRKGDAIEADPGGLERHQFVILGHDPQRNQDGNQAGQRRKLVDQVIAEISEIIGNSHPRSAVPRNVVQQIEEGEDLEQKNEAHQQQHKIEKEISQQVIIQDLRESADEAAARGALERRREIDPPNCGFLFCFHFVLPPPLH